MKVVITGHSYARELEGLGIQHTVISGQNVEFQYIHRLGASYETYLNGRDRDLFGQIAAAEPVIVLVIMAGNSITDSKTDQQIRLDIEEFYGTLRAYVPGARIIAAQIELRFNQENNRHGAPCIDEYRQRRVRLNNFINRCKAKDGILLLSGPNCLDNPDLYKSDGAHLTNEGYQIYMLRIEGMIRSAIQRGLVPLID